MVSTWLFKVKSPDKSAQYNRITKNRPRVIEWNTPYKTQCFFNHGLNIPAILKQFSTGMHVAENSNRCMGRMKTTNYYMKLILVAGLGGAIGSTLAAALAYGGGTTTHLGMVTQ